jgi:hypothetical protein
MGDTVKRAEGRSIGCIDEGDRIVEQVDDEGRRRSEIRLEI